MGLLKVTVLGSGTSGGVPLVGCNCPVCLSPDPLDKRFRSSLLLQHNHYNILIDPGPDFRAQVLQHQLTHIDAILITHGHRDHIAGLDDIRPFNYIQEKNIPIYADELSQHMIREQFAYAFRESDYPYLPKIEFVPIADEPFSVLDITFFPIEVMHGKMPVKGFRVGSFTYITDAKTIAGSMRERVRGTTHLVVNALRQRPHDTHFSLDEALAFVQDVSPKSTWLTHISHHMGKHQDVNPSLPDGVALAYDGLTFELPL